MKKKKNITTIVIAAIVVVVIAFAAVVLPLFTSGADNDKFVYIYPEMTEQALSETLEAGFGKSFAKRVMMLSDYRQIVTEKHVGAYRIKKGMSPFRAWRNMSSGAQTPVKFTFNNVRTLDDFAKTVGTQLCMSDSEILKLVTDSASCASFGFNKQTIPAMLIPDTYEVYWTITPEKLLQKLSDNYKRFWNDSRRNKAAKEGFSPVEIATLASIVEEETANSAEKGTIARLYMNRLQQGIKLQSDPTVKFAVGDPTLRRIMHKHLFTKSPYNTYMNPGLPPGPIRIPEKSTVDAVLNAPQNDYLYMCAKEDFSGSHNFTSSYAEHQRNAQRYQAELNRRGIN